MTTEPRYKDASLTPEDRTADLLSRMSVQEKIAQLTQVWGLTQMVDLGLPHPKDMAGIGVGSMLYVNDIEDKNNYQKAAMEQTSCGIPMMFGSDVAHGHRTAFPLPLAMACSWDEELIRSAQRVAAKEARADGITWTFFPNADIARDARWGRVSETMGEDPYLAARLVAAQVKGFQGDDLSSEDSIAACVKHFVGYGACIGGRDYEQANISENELRNIYYVPFKAGIDAGVESTMTAYMDLNFVPPTADRNLIRNVLRGEMGFDRLIVTDAGTIGNLITQGNAKDGADAAEKAMNASVDMDMGSFQYLQNLPGLLAEGKVSMDQLDEAVGHVLMTKFRLGLFEHPYVEPGKCDLVAADPASRKMARKAAQDSIVLLKNRNSCLPLSADCCGKLAVIGGLADSLSDMGASTAMGIQAQAATPLEALREKLGAERILYAPGPAISRTIPSFASQFMADWGMSGKDGNETPEQQATAISDAVAAAEKADIICAFLGEKADMYSESGSRSELTLPGCQQELLEKLCALGKPVILIMIAGRPLGITWAEDHTDAILMAWQPGCEGGHAIADLLFGDADPSAHLAMTFPRSAGQCPLYYATTLTHQPAELQPAPFSRYWNELSSPLYPFGYGLTYSSFAYSNLYVSREMIKTGESLEISVDVTNTSSRSGREVVQLYLHQRYGSDSRPKRELKGFKKISLSADETKKVTFTIGPKELTYYSTSKAAYLQDSTKFDVWVGSDSTADLHSEFEVAD